MTGNEVFMPTLQRNKLRITCFHSRIFYWLFLALLPSLFIMNSSKLKVKLDDVVIPPQFQEILNFRKILLNLTSETIQQALDQTVQIFKKANSDIIAREVMLVHNNCIKNRPILLKFVNHYGLSIDNSIFDAFFDYPAYRINRHLLDSGMVSDKYLNLLRDQERSIKFFIDKLGVSYLIDHPQVYELRDLADILAKKDWDSYSTICEYGFAKDTPGYFIVFDDLDKFIESISGIQNIQNCMIPASTIFDLDFQPKNILDIAAYHGALKCANYLISQGCNPTDKTLDFAITSGNLELCKLILNKGKNLDPRVFMPHACQHLDEKVCEWVCSFNPAITDPYGEFGPFARAVESCNYVVIFWVLQNFPPPQDSFFDLCLSASFFNDFRLIDYLIELGNINLLDKKSDSNLIFGEELLQYTCQHGGVMMIQYFLDKGVNVNCKGNGQMSPLHNAVVEGNFKAVRYLIEHGADLNAMDSNKFTPLWNAIERWDEEMALFLLANGADPNIVPIREVTCLHMAASHGLVKTVTAMLENGNVQVDPKDNEGKTPLNCAAGNGYYDVCKVLIKHGADVNTHDQMGMTPYINAVWNHKEKVARLLFDHNCSLRNVEDCNIHIHNDDKDRKDYVWSGSDWNSSDEEYMNLQPN